MDPETKALLERSRKRRELLNQRFDNMPKASPRKRAVTENDGTEKVLVQQQSNEDDSPKRHCKRDVERLIKPDTPAIQGVESRIRDLSSSKGVEDQENSVVPVPVPRKSISSPPLERKALAQERVASATDGTPSSSSTGRKGRFAALAQNINSWEDDLTSHVHKKEDVKSSPTKASNKQGNGSPVKKIVSSTALSKPVEEMKKASVVSSPKKTPAPSAPRLPENNFCRSTPLRASKVELNRSPKPFSPVSSEGPGVTKSSDEVITTDKIDKDSTAVPSKLAPKERKLDAKVDQPAKTPISRFMSPEKKVQTPKGRMSMEPSKKPMSAKLAHFEQQIVNNTPRSGLANSARISKLQKQEFTPVPSASVPTVSSRPKDCDPSELPISQRMSRIQEKLASSPFVKGGGVSSGLGKSQEEPTTYPVGARMSAWENISSSGMVSEVKKVNHENVGTASMTPKNPPPAPPPPIAKVITSELTPQKSFKDSIQQKSNEIIGKHTVHSQLSKSPTKKVSSPVKSSVRSPSKVVHSPSKMSKGTKVVQEQLIKKSKEINTTCGTLAAQSRAARMAELDSIQNRWKNGILKDESSSDESNQKADDKVMKAVTPGRREESRNRAREDFASKLSQIEFDETAKASAAPQQSPSVSKDNNPSSGGNKTPSSQTFSIYSLIKKRDEELNQAEDADKKKNTKVTFHDSFFEDDDENMRKVPRSASLRAAQENPVEPETFKKPLTPTGKEGMQQATESDATDVDSVTSSRTSLEIDDDDASLKGFVSEAVRRESTRMIKAPQKHFVRQSSMDSCDDDDDDDVADARGKTDDETHPSSTAAGYRPDVESMDDDDDENDCGAVGELLDEALMDSSDASSYNPDMDPNNVVLRRKPQQTPPSNSYPAQQPAEEYDPDMDINNVVLRRKPRPTNTNSPVAKKTRSHAMAMSTTDDDDDDDDRPYSLSAYRKSVNVNQHNMEPVVRQSKYQGQHVVEEDIPMPSASASSRTPRRCKDDTRAVQDRIKELQELVQHEQNVIMQTSNALNKCCVGNAYFAGSAEQVECNRLLLIACQKRQVYMKEIQRLKQTSMLDASAPGPRGSLTISDIRLPLKKDFVKRIGTSHDNTTHFFILLIRNGCQVICTQMLSTHDSMMRGSLDFPNLIKINGIGGDFKLAVDIYGMSVCREMTLKDKKKKTPRKGKGYATGLQSPGGPMAVRTTSFSHVACVDLNMRCLDKTSFHLDRLAHLSPLYGQIFMRFKCLMESHVEEKGFLTMFDDVSGFGAWHRRWCVLSSNKLCVWKYPDDETRKDPMTIVDLKRCVTEKVGLVPRDICARPNTFEMVTVRQPLKGEHDTLITRTHSTVTTVRHQMSADTKEERIMWCNKINRTLSNLRTWNPDALHPSKQSSSSSSSSSYHH